MASSSSNSKFVDRTSLEEFIEGQENEYTKKKTKQNVQSKTVEEVSSHELSSFISEFIVTVRKKKKKRKRPLKFSNETMTITCPRTFCKT